MAATTITGQALHAFIHRRCAAAERLYAVVDAARDGELAKAAKKQYGRDVKSLFADDAAAHMDRVAPYLVPVESTSRSAADATGFLDRWTKQLGNSSGILLVTTADPEKVRRHLRGVFRATDEDQRKYYFRFYDPRVLRPFLPECTPGDAREFFGPISQVFIEAEQDGTMLCCKPGSDGAVVTEASLNETPKASSSRRSRR